MSKYITSGQEDDICKYLAEWASGRYGKKLTWAIVAKAFGFSRQALSGNDAIKKAYDYAKEKLKESKTEVDEIESATAELRKLRRKVEALEVQNNELFQKYIRWQFNAERHGISLEQLNTPLPPSYKQAIRQRQNKIN